MNKNTIIGSILIAAIVIWWMTTNASNAEAQAAAQAKAKQAAAAEVQKDSSVASELVLPTKTPELKAAPVLGDAGSSEDSSVAPSDSAVDSASVPAPVVIEPRTVVVETEKFIMTLSNKGGKVQSVIVKALPDSTGAFPELIQDTALGALDLKLGKADLSDAMFAVDAPEKIVVEDKATVEFVFSDANGNKVVRSYGFTKDGAAVRQVNKFVILEFCGQNRLEQLCEVVFIFFGELGLNPLSSSSAATLVTINSTSSWFSVV